MTNYTLKVTKIRVSKTALRYTFDIHRPRPSQVSVNTINSTFSFRENICPHTMHFMPNPVA